jgi:hypothetical protein
LLLSMPYPYKRALEILDAIAMTWKLKQEGREFRFCSVCHKRYVYVVENEVHFFDWLSAVQQSYTQTIGMWF